MTTPPPPPARALASGALLPAALVGLGLTLGGALAGAGFARMRTNDRTVSVKGVSEREARADLAIWPLRIIAADDDLAAANASLARQLATVQQFLAEHQLAPDSAGAGGARVTQVTLQDFSVQDARTNQYGNAKDAEQSGNRFVVRETIVVRSTAPERVQAASQQVATLVQRGVVLSSGDGGNGGSGPTYLFKQFSAMKPAMIAEATARAREAAEQFARDSKSALGGIRSASQGAVEILPRDQAPGISEESQLNKTVRVVTTVDYALQ
ncbi:SIMPL domain-containing protein [Gemmatimonadetes bacterium T265]|nr:SIMPL domain-containing protein [Gemmatimonadetes bacterium T265]